MIERKDLGLGAWWIHDRQALDVDMARELLSHLSQQSFEVRTIDARGTKVEQPRLMGWYGAVDYHYSGQTLEARAVPDWMLPVFARVQALTNQSFNHVVINHYRDGRDHVAAHADNEPELGRNPIIASVSLGQTRLFEMTAKSRRKHHRVRLGDRSMLTMGGTSQLAFRHRVPKDGSSKPRYNLTFRRILAEPGQAVAPYLRRVTPWEALEWSKLAKRCFRQTFASDNDPERLEAYLQTGLGVDALAPELALEDNRIWFLWEPKTGSPMGFVHLKRREGVPGVDGVRPLCLSRIYLLRRFRGSGFGDVLMNHAFHIARTEGHDGLWLGVWEHNGPAIRFYERWGFRPVGDMVFDLGGELQTDLLLSAPVES